MSIRDLKKTELLSKVEALKKGGVLLPNDLLEKVDSINEKWELLGVFAFLLLFVGYVYIFCEAPCLISNLRHKYLSLSIHYLHFKQAIHAIMGEKHSFSFSVDFFFFFYSELVFSQIFNNFGSLIRKKVSKICHVLWACTKSTIIQYILIYTDCHA